MHDIQANQTYSFKLNSGEELIARVKQLGTQDDPWFYLESPVSVAPGPQGMGLVMSMFTSEPKESTRLNINNVAMYAPTEEAVRMKYLEATTGIKVPEKKLILG